MDKTVYLHIGTGKTGTTTIQDMLASNRDELLRQGFVYPQVNGERSHAALMLYSAQLSMNDLFRVWIKSSAKVDKDRFREELPDKLAGAIEKFPSKNIIFSSEHLSALLKTDAELSTLKKLLTRFGDRVKIIIYLRRQDEILHSLYSTHVKGGSTKLPDELMAKPVWWLDYADVLDLWARNFGKENIHVQVFDKKRFKNGKLEDDFLGLIGIADYSNFNYIQAKNSSLDRPRLEFLRRFNRHVPRVEGESRNPLRSNLTLVLEQTSSKIQLSYGQSKMEEFYKQYEESNRRVAREYLHQPEGTLFNEGKAKETVEAPLELTVDEAVQIASELWIDKQQTIAKLEERIAKLRKAMNKGRQSNPDVESIKETLNTPSI